MPEPQGNAPRTELKKVRVYCSQWVQCGWKGMRLSDRLGTQPSPCPKCGKDVVR